MLLHTTGTAPELAIAQTATPSVAPAALPQGLVRPGIRKPSLDELLEIGSRAASDMQAGAALQADAVITNREAFGVFFGLRTALLLYAGVGLAAGVAYELWSMLAK